MSLAVVHHMEDLAPAADLPIIDNEQFAVIRLAAEDSGPEFWQDLIDTFVREAEPRFESIQVACDARDLESLGRLSHFLAGSAANLGMLRLATLCRNIEHAVEGERFEAFTFCALSLNREYHRALDALRAELA